MRRWGVVVTTVYTLVLLVFIVPAAVAIVEARAPFWSRLFSNVLDVYQEWMVWMVLAALILCQATLLFLSVDTSDRRLKPRSHIVVSCAAAGLLLMLLLFAGGMSLSAGILGEHFDRVLPDSGWIFAILVGIWMAWGIVFYVFAHKSDNVIKQAMTWLLRASVLELLVAVPCHVIVRRRDDCCAPVVTSFGIATGIAIMLLSFGPSVLILYKKRLETYARPLAVHAGSAQPHASPRA